MGKGQEFDPFEARDRIRRLKSLSGVFHLLTICGLVLSALWLLPRYSDKSLFHANEEMQERHIARQLLLETLDKLARYEQFYHEQNGRYTRDLNRLGLPSFLASGERIDLDAEYELSVLETQPNRFVLLAVGTTNADRVTIDEARRLNANFILPPPSRAYLFEEADRMLRLTSQGERPDDGLYTRYWDVVPEEGRAWVAIGKRSPVLGERRELGERKISSIFQNVSERVKSRLGGSEEQAQAPLVVGQAAAPVGFKSELDARDVRDWLERARFAQYVFRREQGRYARRWEELDFVSDYRFAERMRTVSNVRVLPIKLEEDGTSYQLQIEGTKGSLMGEQFVIDEKGAARQVRYTEALIQRLQETSDLLNAFQVHSLPDDTDEQSQP